MTPVSLNEFDFLYHHNIILLNWKHLIILTFAFEILHLLMNPTLLSVLLCDDDLNNSVFFKEALAELPVSAKLKTVNDGIRLIELLLTKKQPLPNALYLDLNMPRKNGFECLNEIKQNENLKLIPVIIFYTSFNNDSENLLYEREGNFYICKPSIFSHLKKVIFESIHLIYKFYNVQVPKDDFVITAYL